MFEENENLVEESTENTEETVEETEGIEEVTDTTEQSDVEEVTEEPEKLYSEEELNKRVDELLAKKIARKEAKIRRDLERKYSRLETVVNTGLGTTNTEEAVKKLSDFYESKGIHIPQEPVYSDRDEELLGRAEADDIINSGYNDIVEEVDRLAEIGVENMTKRDKIMFQKLANERSRIEDEKALASIGVSREDVNDSEFKEFSNKLNPNLSLKEKYEMYLKVKPKKEIKKIGSMKASNEAKKDYYTPEELDKLTMEDLKDPEVMRIAEYSMQQHYKNSHK